jgi:hypothetical protein
MAKLRGPLLSFSARGQIGQSLVTANWRGVPYARSYAIPANPRTTEQTNTRSVFRFLSQLYRAYGSIGTLPWELASEGRPFTARNAQVRSNIPPLRTATDLSDYIASPGARSGPAPQAGNFTTGSSSGQIDVELEEGNLPTGWTVERACFTALKDQDPHSDYEGPHLELEVSAPGPYQATINTGMPATQFIVSGFFVYQRPDGTMAVSPSVSDVVTSA